MANLSIQNFLHSTKKFSNITTESETKLNFALDATVLNIILTITFNMVVCRFTVLLMQHDGDHSREAKTETSELCQHFTGLSSCYRRTDWSHNAATV